MTNIWLLVGETQPEFHDRGACQGMQAAFTGAEVEEQQAVCNGTTAPWSVPCPVRDECRDWFVDEVVSRQGMQLAYDNVLVHGGLAKRELLALCQAEKKRRREIPVRLCTSDDVSE